MSDLTEVEILDCLKSNLKSATQKCKLLSHTPYRGVTYHELRKELKLIEGACRQMAYWREDTRWLQIGLLMEECHRRSGNWLRNFIKPSPVSKQLFLKLAENLCSVYVACSNLETKATGERGLILPETIPADLSPFERAQNKLILPGKES